MQRFAPSSFSPQETYINYLINRRNVKRLIAILNGICGDTQLWAEELPGGIKAMHSCFQEINDERMLLENIWTTAREKYPLPDEEFFSSFVKKVRRGISPNANASLLYEIINRYPLSGLLDNQQMMTALCSELGEKFPSITASLIGVVAYAELNADGRFVAACKDAACSEELMLLLEDDRLFSVASGNWTQVLSYLLHMNYYSSDIIDMLMNDKRMSYLNKLAFLKMMAMSGDVDKVISLHNKYAEECTQFTEDNRVEALLIYQEVMIKLILERKAGFSKIKQITLSCLLQNPHLTIETLKQPFYAVCQSGCQLSLNILLQDDRFDLSREMCFDAMQFALCARQNDVVAALLLSDKIAKENRGVELFSKAINYALHHYNTELFGLLLSLPCKKPENYDEDLIRFACTSHYVDAITKILSLAGLEEKRKIYLFKCLVSQMQSFVYGCGSPMHVAMCSFVLSSPFVSQLDYLEKLSLLQYAGLYPDITLVDNITSQYDEESKHFNEAHREQALAYYIKAIRELIASFRVQTQDRVYLINRLLQNPDLTPAMLHACLWDACEKGRVEIVDLMRGDERCRETSLVMSIIKSMIRRLSSFNNDQLTCFYRLAEGHINETLALVIDSPKPLAILFSLINPEHSRIYDDIVYESLYSSSYSEAAALKMACVCAHHDLIEYLTSIQYQEPAEVYDRVLITCFHLANVNLDRSNALESLLSSRSFNEAKKIALLNRAMHLLSEQHRYRRELCHYLLSHPLNSDATLLSRISLLPHVSQHGDLVALEKLAALCHEKRASFDKLMIEEIKTTCELVYDKVIRDVSIPFEDTINIVKCLASEAFGWTDKFQVFHFAKSCMPILVALFKNDIVPILPFSETEKENLLVRIDKVLTCNEGTGLQLACLCNHLELSESLLTINYKNPKRVYSVAVNQYINDNRIDLLRYLLSHPLAGQLNYQFLIKCRDQCVNHRAPMKCLFEQKIREYTLKFMFFSGTGEEGEVQGLDQDVNSVINKFSAALAKK